MVQENRVLETIDQNRDRYLNELREFLAIPSISTLPQHDPDVQRAAQWLAEQLRQAGLTKVEIIATDGHPVVYGEWMRAPGKPTVLVYGHYDVQPVDPIEEWDSPPFEPAIRGEDLYARGASDMKAQIHAQIKAVEALAGEGGLPVNLKYLLEGEEEIGSPHLETFLDGHRELVAADVVLNCDGGIESPELPSITYSLRGLAYFELRVQGPKKDLHSGTFGGSVHNPAQVLCELIAGMHNEDGRVALPGFYDDVRPLSPEERERIARAPRDDENWRRLAGVPELWGERRYTTLERIGARPTLEVNGLLSGFTGEGSKTVLPARAMAKLSMRLVPDQKPARVAEQLRDYLRMRAPNTVRWEVIELAHCPAAITRRDTPAMAAAEQALKTVFGKDPIFMREGGSVPVVALLQEKLGIDSVMLGFELPDAGFHGPNEKMHLPTYYRGIETYVRFMSAL
jgi:acetylornithine deacetylase/succinyl-diaminopimelate desuccinylase-like protein